MDEQTAGHFYLQSIFDTKYVYILGCITFTEVGPDEDCNEYCVKFNKKEQYCQASIGNFSFS